VTILCAKGALLGRDISRPIVKYMGNIRREPKLFGRWQWRCDLLLPLQQQLVSRGSVATRSPRLDRIWTVDTAHSMRQGLCNGTVSICLSLRLYVPSVDRYMPLRRFAAVGSAGRRYPSMAAVVGRLGSTAFISKCEQCHVVS